MKILAEKIVTEMTEDTITKITTAYVVLDGESVEALLRRIGVNDNVSWHYSLMEVRLKLISE